MKIKGKKETERIDEILKEFPTDFELKIFELKIKEILCIAFTVFGVINLIIVMVCLFRLLLLQI